MNKQKTGTLFLLVGPSRVGKDSILRGLLKKPLGLRKLVTVTTRDRRPREIPGKTYHYVSDEKFSEMIRRNQLLEWAPVRNHRFGVPKEPLLTWLKSGHNVVQQIDVRGADSLIRQTALRVVTIFILPGSLKDLEKRLSSRLFTAEQRRIRWEEALKELSKQAEYDYRVVNTEGELSRAIREVAEIVAAVSGHASRFRGARRPRRP
jgi:guanylate kinase